MARPRISEQTESALNILDQRYFDMDEEDRPSTLEKRPAGRGSGSNHFTQDSVILTALNHEHFRLDEESV